MLERSHSSTSRMESIRVECSYDVAFNSCIEAAQQCNFNIEQEKPPQGVITASTDATFLSWGEKVRIELYRVNNKSVEINVESEPLSPIQIIDWGKNKENEKIFINEIEEIWG